MNYEEMVKIGFPTAVVTDGWATKFGHQKIRVRGIKHGYKWMVFSEAHFHSKKRDMELWEMAWRSVGVRFRRDLGRIIDTLVNEVINDSER